jgi:hypothetical protein
MKSSETLGKLAKALAAFQGSLKPAAKDSENPYFKSKYADLTSLWESCRESLAKNELSVVQTFAPDETNSGILWIETLLLHSSGEWLSSLLGMNKLKQDPQSLGSLITYGRRYALGAILGLVTDEDDDANAAMPKPGEKTQQTSARLANIPSAQRSKPAEAPKPVEEKSITEKLITGELEEDPDPPTVNPGEPGKVSPFKKPEAAKPAVAAHNDADPIDETTWSYIKAQFPDNWADEKSLDFEDWVRATLKANGLTPVKDLSKLTRAMGRTLLQVAVYCGAESVLEFVVPDGYQIPKPKAPAK